MCEDAPTKDAEQRGVFAASSALVKRRLSLEDGIKGEQALGFFDEEGDVHEGLVADVDPADAVVGIDEYGGMEGVVFEVVEGSEGAEGDEMRVAEQVQLVWLLEVGEFGPDFDGVGGDLGADGVNGDALGREGVEMF